MDCAPVYVTLEHDVVLNLYCIAILPDAATYSGDYLNKHCLQQLPVLIVVFSYSSTAYSSYLYLLWCLFIAALPAVDLTVYIS